MHNENTKKEKNKELNKIERNQKQIDEILKNSVSKNFNKKSFLQRKYGWHLNALIWNESF